MAWPSFFIGCGVTAVLAAVAWAYVSAVRDLREQGAMIAAYEAEKAKEEGR